MANFDQLNNNIQNILIELVSSKDLCKLIHYDTDDPLSEEDIEDTTTLLFTKIYPFPRVPDVTQNATTYLNVFFDSFSLGENYGIKEGLLNVNIITHSDLWRINGALRPFSILSEVDKIFNKNRVVGLKKLRFYKANQIWANDNFSGYQVSYKIASEN